MVDAADHDKLEASRNELHNLLDKPQLQGIPILVLGNKRDLDGALDEKDLIERMWVVPFRLVPYNSALTKVWNGRVLFAHLFWDWQIVVKEWCSVSVTADS